jgi:hypothetical protein
MSGLSVQRFEKKAAGFTGGFFSSTFSPAIQ